METNLKTLRDKAEIRLKKDGSTDWVVPLFVIDNLEAELRQKMFEQDKMLAKVPKKIRSKEHSINIEEILG